MNIDFLKHFRLKYLDFAFIKYSKTIQNNQNNGVKTIKLQFCYISTAFKNVVSFKNLEFTIPEPSIGLRIIITIKIVLFFLLLYLCTMIDVQNDSEMANVLKLTGNYIPQ